MKSTFLQPDGQLVLVETLRGVVHVHILNADYESVAETSLSKKKLRLKDIGMTEREYHGSIRRQNATNGNKLILKNSTGFL